jgi:chromosome segregation ATPase
LADYKGLNIKWEADGSEASKALHLISADAKAAQGNLNAVQGALSNVTTNGKALNDELRDFQLANLNRAMDDAAKKARVYSELLPQLRDRQSDLRKEIDDTKDAIDTLNGGAHFGDVSKSIRDLEAHLNSLEEQERKAAAEVDNTNQKMLVQESRAKTLSAAYQSLSVNMAASQTGMGQFGADAKKAGESLNGIGDAISSVGDKMTVVSGIAALTFGRNVISSTE